METGAAEKENGGAEGKRPLKERLKLWWDGYEIREKKAAPKIVDEEPPEDEGPPTVMGWAVSRQRSVVTLFGDGMIRCVPDDVKKRMTTPMGVNKTMSVAELGAGLGGFAQWVVDEFEAYVDAYESEEPLVDAGKELIKMAGQTRFIRYIHADFEDFQPKDHSANVVYSAEALFCVKNKELLFNRIHDMLKAEGQFMMSDYMLDGSGEDDPNIQKWFEAEPDRPHLLDVQKTRALMTKAGFEVSIAEDITAEYKANVLAAFADYARRTGRGEKSGHLHDWVLKEGELWTARVKAMESGSLKVFRIYARVPAKIV
ncbi:methyltransferase domain-containing protein [Sneathiella sp. P13V-1]|uniref:class I SAM-dependent methyltransferase n=1 Tax=Sneathiella sp. P13V-1 TaxID=2697366 RepID=UPI00187B6D3A|nr:class I SAM-dependent methyltransferase [Sneathiella sp. P13V-1]MBE7638602.1 methyltransferase domain-containing protein [Sneathiella sp. P13V-1]